MTHFKNIALLIILILFFSNCGGDEEGNAFVTVYNKTNRKIKIYYKYKDEHSGSTETVNGMAEIASNDEKTISVEPILYDADIDILYSGIIKNYDLDFEPFFLTDNVKVYSSDFNSIVVK